MRVSRLFVQASLVTGETLRLESDCAHYLRSVLRLKKGCEITLYNGSGGEFSATLSEVSRKVVEVSVGEWRENNSEPALEISLGLAITRGERMDIAIQKAVELGVSSITPLITEFPQLWPR